MSKQDWRIPAIKYHQLHGLDPSTPIPKRNYNFSNEINSFPLLNWWKNRVEKTFTKYSQYPDEKILLNCFIYASIVPFLYFQLPKLLLLLQGTDFSFLRIDPYQPIWAVLFAPIWETLVFFLIPLEIARVISFPRWFSYPLVFIFFESMHDQRSFFEHPLMWMTGYMFIVAYEAGRTRSILHAILFCIVVHEAYNLLCYLLHPATYFK